MDGWKYEWINGRRFGMIDRWMFIGLLEWMKGCMDARMDRETARWMKFWLFGLMDHCMI